MKTAAKKIATIDAYIRSQSKDVQNRLKQMRITIQAAAPKAVEGIKYQMPTFILNGNLVHFAAAKKHIGFYPTPSAIVAFQKDLTKYETSKGAIQFPLDKPLPLGLVKKIVLYRVKETIAKAKGK